jgi:antitoxin VapB
MATEHAKVFVSNRSQAVRLPKAVALPDNIREVDVTAVGEIRIITPSGRRWDDWFDGPGVSDDFMAERERLEEQQKESL